MNIKITWSSILPAMLAVAANNPTNQAVMEEFRRMAKLADKYVDEHEKDNWENPPISGGLPQTTIGGIVDESVGEATP